MLLTLNDLILNYWQRRFEKEIVIHIFRLVIYIWCYTKRKKNLFHKKEKIWFRENWIRIFADFQVSSSVIFAGYKMREMLLDFVLTVYVFPLLQAYSSSVRNCTRVLGKCSNSWVPRKRNIAENYFFHVHFII